MPGARLAHAETGRLAERVARRQWKCRRQLAGNAQFRGMVMVRRC